MRGISEANDNFASLVGTEVSLRWHAPFSTLLTPTHSVRDLNVKYLALLSLPGSSRVLKARARLFISPSSVVDVNSGQDSA